jgi:iron complex outermembrane recepter protein
MSHRHEKRVRRATRNLLLTAASLEMLAIALPSAAQNAEAEPVEEVIVTGIRAAQKAAIDIKRDAMQVIDSISAEDIGKLPDVTISDSLQRVPGVQIRREAGEGSGVNVRGLPQVTTLLNGEQYLGANSITNVQPNFGDIPSQLFSGVDVLKSPTADLLNGGITGTVNLRTRRPFDLGEGFTGSVAAEAAYGSGKGEVEPQVNGLVGWRNDTFGALLSVSYGNVTQANYYNGLQGNTGWTGRPNEGTQWPGEAGGDGDLNGDGDATDAMISYQGHTAFNKFTERERLGVNASFQAQLDDNVRLSFDAFFTDQTQFDRTAGFAAEDKWQRWEWWRPIESTPTGAFVGTNEISTTQVYGLDTRRLKSYSDLQRTESKSQNFNLQLDFGDADSRFSGTIRALKGTASQDRVNSYADIDLSNGSHWGLTNNYYPSGFDNPYSPTGYTTFPQITADYTGEHVRFSGIPANVGDLTAYSIGALSSENNFDREADLGVLRFDTKFRLNDQFSVDAGVRFAEREAENLAYDYLAPFYAAQSSNGTGCLVKWKATDVVLNGGGIAGACSAGDATPGAMTYYTALPSVPLSQFGNDVIQVSDFGGVAGVPAMYVLNPEAMDNPLAFHNSLFPGNVKVSNPGQSYIVNLDQQTAYLQGNFAGGDGPFSANAGVRFVKTKLDVTQNNVGAPQPYGAANTDAGDTVTRREFTDYLPTLNVAYDFTDSLKLRGAFAKTMTMLDLQQWGGALSPSYAISNAEGGRFIVIGANSDGNPALNPWRSKNYDVSLEWYAADQTLVSAALFYVQIASFIERGTVVMALPDQDGIVRRTVNVNTNVQGDGGNLKGVELGVKHAFTEGFLQNFGIDANYTYSPSNSGKKDLTGNTVPFQDNSVHQSNLAIWYQGEKLQARIAHNYRSKRAVALDQVWGTEGLTYYQQPTQYIDASVSYDVTPDFTVYLQGSNLTDEYEDYYLQWGNQYANQNIYERRLLLGVRARFGAAGR